MERIKTVNRMYDYSMTSSLEQKKVILNILLHDFILMPDGRIELRYELLVTEKILDTVTSMLSIDISKVPCPLDTLLP